MSYPSDAHCHIAVEGVGDPDNHADNEARLKDIITDTLDGDDFNYPPAALDIVERDGVINVYFEHTDSKLYVLSYALLATLRNLVDDGWTIVDVAAKRIGIDSFIENPDIETWAVLDGHILASNYDGPIGSIRRHGDMWDDTDGTTIITETNLSAMVAETIAAHIGVTSVDDTQVQTKIAALTSLGAFTALPQAMTQAELTDIIARLLD